MHYDHINSSFFSLALLRFPTPNMPLSVYKKYIAPIRGQSGDYQSQRH